MSDFDFFSPPSPQEAERAQAYLKQAERDSALIPGLARDLNMRDVRSVAIIGAGTMGGGMAMCFANLGLPVALQDMTQDMLDRGMQRLRDNYQRTVDGGRLDQAVMDQRMSLITPTLEDHALTQVDLIIEAVFEDIEIKQNLFRKLDGLAKKGAILATNTSGLDIDEIASVTHRPRDVIGAHFFSPANVMRLLEVVRTRDTSDEVIATLMDLGHRMGKVSILARVSPGFIGNALLRNYSREAQFLVEDGAFPHEVDAALTAFGYRMGIFAVHDMAGNDVGLHTKRKQILTRPKDRRYTDLIIALCDQGRLGQKTGKGWYRYEKGDRRPQRDPDVEAFLIAESTRLGLTRAPIARQDMIKRCLYTMINEAAHLLDTGVARRARDIDIAYVTGYGFPADHGGPTYLADKIGLASVYQDIADYHARFGVWWQPSPLLERLAREGQSFAAYDQQRTAAWQQGAKA